MSASVTIPIAVHRTSTTFRRRKGLRSFLHGETKRCARLREVLRLAVSVHGETLGAARDGNAVEELPNCRSVEDIASTSRCGIDFRRLDRAPPMLAGSRAGHRQDPFARKIAQLLGTGFRFVPMSSLTAGWVLSDASSQWKNAKAGKVFALPHDYANGDSWSDELDKASSDGSTTVGALYRAARVETSTRSSMSSSSCRSTRRRALLRDANDAGRIRTPSSAVLASTRSRRRTRRDSCAHRRHLREIRSAHDWGRQFPDRSRAGAREAGVAAAREMRVWSTRIRQRKLAGRGEIGPDDLQDAPSWSSWF